MTQWKAYVMLVFLMSVLAVFRSQLNLIELWKHPENKFKVWQINVFEAVSPNTPRGKQILVNRSIHPNTPINVSDPNTPRGKHVNSNDVFYFAVTHHSTINKRINSSISTWCARVHAHTGRKVIWYSNRPDPRVDHVVSFDGVDAYFNITWRMMAIWKHVATHYPGHKWYSRFWDDNIVFPETFENLLTGLDPDEAIEIGRVAKHPSGVLVRPGEEGNADSNIYFDGGAGSLMSRAAFTLFTDNIDRCKEWIQNHSYECYPWCEDVLLSDCSTRMLGIRAKRGLGMFHTTPPILQISDAELRQHAIVSAEDEWSMVRTMHYAEPDAMERIDKLWYQDT